MHSAIWDLPSRPVTLRSSSCSSRTAPQTMASEAPPSACDWPHLSGTIRDGSHAMAVRVYYEDTDFSGVVYHASYLRFMERGRTEYLRLIGADHRALFEAARVEAPGFAFVVRSMAIEFLKPALMDDVLEVTTRPDEVKGASVVLCQQVRRTGEVLVDARVRVAFVSGGPRRPDSPPVRLAVRAEPANRPRRPHPYP